MDLDPPSADDIAELYRGADYFVKEGSTFAGAGEAFGYSEDYLAERSLIEAKFDLVLGHLERYVPKGRLLDVGCGPGFLVSAATRRGWEAIGLDVNAWATEYGRVELGLDVRTGDLAGADLAPGSFDAVTLMDVIEHVPDPDEMLRLIEKLVRPGGAVALLTPNAASWPSRILGRKWPEARRPGEHLVLFSVDGLSAAVNRSGFVASGWHSIGKIAPVGTLLSDIEGVAPGAVSAVRSRLSDETKNRVVNFDPHTKFVLYARRSAAAAAPSDHAPARLPRDPGDLVAVEDAILDELGSLRDAKRYARWLFDQFSTQVAGSSVLEVGAGIGTFTTMMLDEGAAQILTVEPDPQCADVLDREFGADGRVTVVREFLPDAPSLDARPASFDLVVCQNVLEHIDDDVGALGQMHSALRPGGHLLLIVPAGPRLFGALDDAYGHWRRYTAPTLRSVVEAGGFEIERVGGMNLLGAVGWWAKARRPGARVGAGSLRVFDAMVPAMRALEGRLELDSGLSLMCLARRPGEAP